MIEVSHWCRHTDAGAVAPDARFLQWFVVFFFLSNAAKMWGRSQSYPRDEQRPQAVTVARWKLWGCFWLSFKLLAQTPKEIAEMHHHTSNSAVRFETGSNWFAISTTLCLADWEHHSIERTDSAHILYTVMCTETLSVHQHHHHHHHPNALVWHHQPECSNVSVKNSTLNIPINQMYL